MRRIFVWSIILLLLMSLCGCKSPAGIEFDPNNIRTKDGVVYASAMGHTPPEKYATYSDVTDQLGIGGMIAAGYATGLRKSYDGHTDTQFVVTDIYHGHTFRKTIIIEEAYYYSPGYGFQYNSSDFFELTNDIQVLVFLDRIAIGRYRMIWRYIPLMPDYNEYDDVYLQSVLNFFRGDKEEYIAEGPWKETVTIPSGKTVHIGYHLAFWEEREISDEALLEEMKDHLLLRTATEYKIAIWPFGHKNFTQNQYAERQFMRISIPMEEYFK